MKKKAINSVQCNNKFKYYLFNLLDFSGNIDILRYSTIGFIMMFMS
jgi:hypothetical protein